MNLVRSPLLRALATLATASLTAAPAGAHYYYRSYYCPVAKKVVRQKVIVKKEVVVVEKPVIVKENVSYLATIIPANTYNTTVHVPAQQAVQAAQLTATFGVAAQQQAAVAAQGAQYGAAQQGYAHPPAPQNAAPPPQQAPPRQQRQVTADERLERIEVALLNLCDTLKANGNGGNGHAPNGNGAARQERPPGFPQVLATHCAVCHNATSAPRDGGGFVLYDKGAPAILSVRDLHQIGRHVRANTMPPPGNPKGVPPLTPQQAQAVQQWLDAQE